MCKYILILFCILNVVANGQTCFTIQNVHVISMVSDTVLANQTLLIRDGVIEDIDYVAKMVVPPHCSIIDGQGKYVIPGLINMYTHVNESNLMLYLAHGQTTVRDIPSHINVLGLRAQVNRGEIIGPRILAYGLRATGAPAPYHGQQPIFNAEQGRQQVKEAKRLGYDGMMIYATCLPESYDAILEEAEQLQFPISGHFPIFIDEDVVLSGKQLEFDNLTGITRRGELIIDRHKLIDQLKVNSKAITPSLAVHKIWSLADKKDSLFHASWMNYIPPKLKANWQPEQNDKKITNLYPYEQVAQFVKELSDNDIQIFIGSDGGYPLVAPGFAFLDEMELYAQAGISNEKILKYATVDAARFLHLNDIGTLECGKKAEIVLLSKNPLVDMANIRLIDGVMTGGHWLTSGDLDDELNMLEKRINQPRNRFQAWADYLNLGEQSLEFSYKFVSKDYEVGAQKVILDTLSQSTFSIRSVMVADEPDYRETYSFHRMTNKVIDSLYILNKGSEGDTEVALTRIGDTVSINGFSPFHGRIAYRKFAPAKTQLWCPFVSRYFELDNVVNYWLALCLTEKLEKNEANLIRTMQIELNSEEYGEAYIVDESTTTIYKTNENEYRIIYPGFSGYANRTSLPFNILVKTSDDRRPKTMEYQDLKIQNYGNE